MKKDLQTDLLLLGYLYGNDYTNEDIKPYLPYIKARSKIARRLEDKNFYHDVLDTYQQHAKIAKKV